MLLPIEAGQRDGFGLIDGSGMGLSERSGASGKRERDRDAAEGNADVASRDAVRLARNR